MASSKFGQKLNPYRSLQEPLGVKGVRQYVVITHYPSTIGPGQQLSIRFPSLGRHNVIVSGTLRLAFTITLNSDDSNRTLVQNIGRTIVKKLVVKVSGNEVLSIDHSDVLGCYFDLWRMASERENGHYQGIDTSANWNTTRIRVGTGNKDEAVVADKAIADVFSNRFHIPLDFELLETHMPFY